MLGPKKSNVIYSSIFKGKGQAQQYKGIFCQEEKYLQMFAYLTPSNMISFDWLCLRIPTKDKVMDRIELVQREVLVRVEQGEGDPRHREP